MSHLRIGWIFINGYHQENFYRFGLYKVFISESLYNGDPSNPWTWWVTVKTFGEPDTVKARTIISGYKTKDYSIKQIIQESKEIIQRNNYKTL